MNTKRTTLLLLLTTAIGIGTYAAVHAHSGSPASGNTRKVRVYQDSMHPWIQSDHPGKCTICEMDLTPIYEGEKGFAVSDDVVVLSSNSITVLNVQTEEAKRQPLGRTLRVAGTLEPDETSKVIISAPAPGRVKMLSVGYVGAEVQEGQTLVSLFSPQLTSQRRSFFAAQSSKPSTGTETTDTMAVADPFSGDLVAPRSGVVVERNISEGQFVAEGERLLSIVSSTNLWFRFDVYEGQLAWLEPGQALDVTVQAVPGKKFKAVVAFIEPVLNDSTRSVKVRANIKNPLVEIKGRKERQLRYGMYAEARLKTDSPDVLAIPQSAVLYPGTTAYVYVEKGNGAYERRGVKLGRRGDTHWEIVSGLDEGDRVVTSGNVLMDAQAQLYQGERSVDADDVSKAMVSNEMETDAKDEEISQSPGPEPIRPAGSHLQTAMAQPVVPSVTAIIATNARAAMAMAGKLPVRTNAAPAGMRQHPAGRRSQMMSAIMSPGEELQLIRKNAILEARRQDTNSTPASAGSEN